MFNNETKTKANKGLLKLKIPSLFSTRIIIFKSCCAKNNHTHIMFISFEIVQTSHIKYIRYAIT